LPSVELRIVVCCGHTDFTYIYKIIVFLKIVLYLPITECTLMHFLNLNYCETLKETSNYSEVIWIIESLLLQIKSIIVAYSRQTLLRHHQDTNVSCTLSLCGIMLNYRCIVPILCRYTIYLNSQKRFVRLNDPISCRNLFGGAYYINVVTVSCCI